MLGHHDFVSAHIEQYSADSLHQRLRAWNRLRMSPALEEPGWQEALAFEMRFRLLEGEFVEREREAVAAQLAEVPCDPDGFVAWFEALRKTGPGQSDPLFPWLAQEATLADIKWVLTQEIAAEAGFDDLVALTQLRMPVQAKLELARNYWDEMGQGHPLKMHGPMLGELALELGLPQGQAGTVWEVLAVSNLMAALAANRRYAYQSIGALGVLELTVPVHASYMNVALRRFGVSPQARRYFAIHATLDVQHAEAWSREVLRPLVAEEPRTARAIAEGALLRLSAGARCYERYRRDLGFEARHSISQPLRRVTERHATRG